MIFIENEQTELKEIVTSAIKKEVIAFLNTKGGIIYIGISDNGKVIGIENVDETLLQLTNSLRDSIKPDAMMFVYTEQQTIENKNIIKITINEGTRKPYYLTDKGLKPSGVYVRQSSSTAQASEDAIRTMIKFSDGDSFENNRSLEQNLTFTITEKEFTTRELDFTETQKKNLGLLTQENTYTNLALLLSEQCKHSIKIAVFQGTDKTIFRDREEITGSLFEQLEKSFYFINFHNNTRSTFEGLRRIDTRSYPTEAIREALLNALVHRDYSFSGSISVNIYSDRIEIISLGGLVSGLTIEAVMMGASQPRNEKVASLFYRMKLIESYGIGIGKIMSSYKDFAIKPSFESAEGAFRVVLPNINAITTRLTNSQNKVIDYLKSNPSITRSEIEKLLDIKTTRANTIINELLELHILIKSGNGKNSKYILA